MRNKIIAVALASIAVYLPALAENPEQDSLVYSIPIHEMIEPALTYVLSRQVDEGLAAGADAFIFTMDTPGGAVGAAEDIIELISDIDVPTYTFVERNAISAGALIALATDAIYMAPGSKIGDAMPFQANPLGGAAETPERINEKIESYVASLARTTAQRHGHNPDVAMAMVRPDYELVIDGKVVSPKGQLLTLTNAEAEELYGSDPKPLLSAGTVVDEQELLKLLGLEKARVVHTEISLMERVGRLIPPVGPLLLMLGLLGIYVEMRTPGIGLPGLLGGICLVIFFWGHHIAGLAGLEDVVIFGLGVLLLMIELLLIPGFGIAGILGILLMLAGIFMAMIDHLPTAPGLPIMPRLELPLRNMAITIIGTAVGALLLGRFLPKSSLFRRLALADSTSRGAGYSSSQDLSEHIGKTGVATCALRPSGTARFGDERLDVIAAGEFIATGTEIRIVAVKGNHLQVEPL
jgi:membrane-bound serine protease (ClpP class)